MPPLTRDTATGKAYWRSLDELADAPEFRRFVEREFPAYADEMLAPASRRGFLKMMGASLALAAASLALTAVRAIAAAAAAPAATAGAMAGATTGATATAAAAATGTAAAARGAARASAVHSRRIREALWVCRVQEDYPRCHQGEG